MTPEAIEFAPGLLAIQESPPSKLPKTILYLVVVLFFILLLLVYVNYNFILFDYILIGMLFVIEILPLK